MLGSVNNFGRSDDDILYVVSCLTWTKNLECYLLSHTAYSRNKMGQKCEDNCGLWVLNEIGNRIYPENLKKIVDAVWELCTC